MCDFPIIRVTGTRRPLLLSLQIHLRTGLDIFTDRHIYTKLGIQGPNVRTAKIFNVDQDHLAVSDGPNPLAFPKDGRLLSTQEHIYDQGIRNP